MQKAIGNIFRSSVVSIDSYDGKVLKGRLYNASLEGAAEFGSYIEFLILVEKLLDDLNFPQSFSAMRSFGAPQPGGSVTSVRSKVQSGRLATLELRILFRQNASWQGSVKWVEGNREEVFRSVLELTSLINSALEQ